MDGSKLPTTETFWYLNTSFVSQLTTVNFWLFFFRCDADPSALSKYVLALIKKDKPESELRDSMTNQMEVFLQENTNTFIESLFTTLQNGDYVEGPPKVVARKADADDLVRAHHLFSRIFNLRILFHEILFAYFSTG